MVTALVMGAAAAFMLATSSVWHATESAQANAQSSIQMKGRLQNVLRESAAIGAVETGVSTNPAVALIWRGDANSDGQVQTSETALLTHDVTNKSLLIQFPVVSGADTTWTAAAFNSPATISTIRSNTLKSHVLLRRVSAANFGVLKPSGSIQRTIFEYDVTTTNGKTSDRYYGTTALRTPLQPK